MGITDLETKNRKVFFKVMRNSCSQVANVSAVIFAVNLHLAFHFHLKGVHVQELATAVQIIN